MKYLTYIVFALGYSVSNTALASIFEAGFRHFQQIQNSPEITEKAIVTTIAQDSQDFLWIGTQEGLLRFDGYQFQRIRPDFIDQSDLISISNIKASGDYLWIGTETQGLLQYDIKRQQFSQYIHDTTTLSGINSNYVRALMVDNQQRLWVGTNKGVSILLPGEVSFQPVFAYGDNGEIIPKGIRSFAQDNQSVIWVGTTNGLYYVDENSNSLIAFNGENAAGAAQQNIQVLLPINDTLWIGTSRHSYAFIKNQSYHQPELANFSANIKNAWVFSGQAMPNNEIWFTTFGQGILVIDENTQQIKEIIKHDPLRMTTLGEDKVSVVMNDRSGITWIGTWGEGLYRYNANNDSIRTLHQSLLKPEGIPQSSYTAVYQAKDRSLWLGLTGGGVSVLSDYDGSLIKTYTPNESDSNSIGSSQVIAITQTSDGSIWVATYRSGLYKLDRNTDQFQKVLPEISSIRLLIKGDNDQLYMASNDKIIELNTKNGQTTTLPMANGEGPIIELQSLATTRDGGLWAGGLEGLFYKPSDQSLVHKLELLPDSIVNTSPQIYHISIDQQDRVWVSKDNTVYQALLNDNLSLTLKPIQAKKRAYNFVINDKEQFWSPNFYLDLPSQKAYPLSIHDGFNIGTDWRNAYHATADGLYLLCGTKGLLMVKTQRFEPWTFSPKIALTRIKSNGQEINGFLDQVELFSRERNLSFEFAALDYSGPESIQYKYRLKGFDDAWNQANYNYRSASYTNLAPGQYTLEINATNRIGVWNENPFIMPITVHPMWYETFWFRFLCLVSILAFITFLFRFRVRFLEKQVRARNAELDFLNKVGQELNTFRDIDRIFSQLYHYLNEIMDVFSFAIGLTDKYNNTICFSSVMENNTHLSSYTETLSGGDRLSSLCVMNNQEIILLKKEQQRKYNERNMAPSNGSGDTQSIIYMPLSGQQNQVVGCLTIQSLNENAYTKQQIDIVRTLANYTAIAIDNSIAYAKLEDSTLTDHLTGLNNRRFLHKVIDQDIEQVLSYYTKFKTLSAEAKCKNLLFFLIDIDHFKSINDTYGHSAGDTILKQVSDILKEIFSDSDYIIRWGGEEFLVILKDCDRLQADQWAEVIRDKVQQNEFQLSADKTINTTVSVGFAPFPFFPSEPKLINWLTIIDLADHCLYAVKKSARNGWVGLIAHEQSTCVDAAHLIKDTEQQCRKAGIKITSSMNKVRF